MPSIFPVMVRLHTRPLSWAHRRHRRAVKEQVGPLCSTKTSGSQRVGNLRKGQFNFIFYYLPLLLNSMGGAWGLWHCSQKHCPCQAEFAPSQVLIDCDRKTWSPSGSSFLRMVLHLPSGCGKYPRKGEYLSGASRQQIISFVITSVQPTSSFEDLSFLDTDQRKI